MLIGSLPISCSEELFLELFWNEILKHMLFPGTILGHHSQTLVNQAMQRKQSQQHTQAKAYKLLRLYLLSSKPYIRIGLTLTL